MQKEYGLSFDIPGIYVTVPDLHPRSQDQAPGWKEWEKPNKNQKAKCYFVSCQS